MTDRPGSPRPARLARAASLAVALARLARVAGLAAALLFLLGAQVLAHAALVSSNPADGATIPASPTAITATFSEAIAPDRSSMQLSSRSGASIAPSGATVMNGGADPTDTTSTKMVIDLPAPLAAGQYDVRWITVTPDDNGLERGTFSFTIDPGGSPGAGVSPGASAGPAASGGGGSGSSGGGTSGTGTDVIVPVAIAVVAAAVLAAALLMRQRGRRDPADSGQP